MTFAMVVGIGGGVAYGARRITTGAKRRSPDELATIGELAKGQNVFTTDLDRARVAELTHDPDRPAAG
jgi:hypothetical protein